MTETGSNSRLVALLTRAGMACLLFLPLPVLAIRLGLDFRIGLLVFALSGLLGAVIVILLGLLCLLPRYRGVRSQALRGTLPALPPALLVLAILSTGGKYPEIHDITTDTEDPPVFDSGVYYRGENANTVDIKPDVIEIQKEFYPKIQTIRSDLSSPEAFARATAVAEELGWEIYNSDPDNGRIEAAYTSFWFGFVDMRCLLR